MARTGDFERVVEYGASTYHRVALAKDAYEKLFKLRPGVFVCGEFEDNTGEVFTTNGAYVQVDITSTGFYHRASATTFHKLSDSRSTFDFMLDRPAPGA